MPRVGAQATPAMGTVPALNGLGSILVYERDLNAAEFFIRRAIHYAEKDGADYAEAKHDLALVLRYKNK